MNRGIPREEYTEPVPEAAPKALSVEHAEVGTILISVSEEAKKAMGEMFLGHVAGIAHAIELSIGDADYTTTIDEDKGTIRVQVFKPDTEISPLTIETIETQIAKLNNIF